MKAAHPRRSTLALLAGGDLGWWERRRVSGHVRGCDRCGRAVEAFRADRESWRAGAETPPEHLDWDRLAAEMTANIRVGLAAGQCVGSARPARRLVNGLGWRPAAAFASVAAVLAGGWWLSFPDDAGHRVSNAERFRQMFQTFDRRASVVAPFDNVVTVGSTQDGLEVKQNGAVLRIAHPGAAPSVVTASTSGSVRARYVDDETGQVTITNVYSQ